MWMPTIYLHQPIGNYKKFVNQITTPFNHDNYMIYFNKKRQNEMLATRQTM